MRKTVSFVWPRFLVENRRLFGLEWRPVVAAPCFCVAGAFGLGWQQDARFQGDPSLFGCWRGMVAYWTLTALRPNDERELGSHGPFAPGFLRLIIPLPKTL